MNWKWNSSSHPISDLRDWSKQKRLEIRPDFQRKAVWSPPARILLMDTILRNIPMPKVFLQAVIRNDDTYRVVIDGQQRIKAILDFLADKIELAKPYVGVHEGKRFSALPREVQEEFLSYKIDFNEIRNAPEDIVRDIYSRVNKYTVALNRQELRRADFPGQFLNVAEELVSIPFLEDGKVFTVANSKRMGDVEFVSELLALLLAGPQEKRKTLDEFYLNYSEWPEDEIATVKERFMGVLKDIELIFTGGNVPFSKTRFRQKADFYSLFAAVDLCRNEGGTIAGKPLSALLEDLTMVDMFTAPESETGILREYAVKCVSQGNSLSSRRWRRDFLKHFLDGTYFSRRPSPAGMEIFESILYDGKYSSMCSIPFTECPICDKEIEGDQEDILAWPKSAETFQLSNAVEIHKLCGEKASNDYSVGAVPEPTDPELPIDHT